ncbi:conserved hypothetical protein [uncultured Desulfatiglans sp.]|uniref:DNA 3'-5' helicase n=1 Tax=Uncultured Desulfatiglans sp. TaxID=1748965 RepID=A0A653AG30_UNCDX|nr:conserved hypothetical protein [uncultured Desulfatiglans sp.]
MTPTEEQQAILDSTGRVLLINARAGTGKTTTLRMIASAHPDLKVLYLVYNRKAREEALGRFPANVEIRTVHSLAFSGDAGRWIGQLGAFTAADLLPAFRGGGNAQQLAAVGYDFMEFFLNSPFPKVEAAMEAFREGHLGHVAGEVREAVEGAQDLIVQTSREILGQWYRQEKPCPHDFYLKLFHREGGFSRSLDRYDMVLVDEGQDLSPVMLDALAHCRKRVVIVGDSHQQIYSFRYAIDAMKRLPFDDQRDLTLSFRFGREIADLASVFIREAKGEAGFRIEGSPRKASRVRFSSGLPRPRDGERCAILSRTNLALFEKALELRSRRVSFSLEGSVGAVLGRILDVYRLSEDEHGQIRDPFIRSFKGLDALEEYARNLDDFQLAGMARLVREKSPIFPDALYDMMRISKRSGQGGEGPRIILSTVHGAKGREFERVTIDADLSASLSKSGGPPVKELGDEANVAYVGFTRAIRELSLPQEFKNVLTPEWQSAVKRYEEPRIPEAAAASQDGGAVRGFRPFSKPALRFLKTVVPPPKTPRKKPFKVGDAVRTIHGEGTVVEVDGDAYLVRLEDRGVRLWEKAWALKKG